MIVTVEAKNFVPLDGHLRGRTESVVQPATREIVAGFVLGKRERRGTGWQ